MERSILLLGRLRRQNNYYFEIKAMAFRKCRLTILILAKDEKCEEASPLHYASLLMHFFF
jgi:hypothetical protein